jgi:hypothetical protein
MSYTYKTDILPCLKSESSTVFYQNKKEKEKPFTYSKRKKILYEESVRRLTSFNI